MTDPTKHAPPEDGGHHDRAPRPSRLDAVLFDMDGVLVDSREAWYRAFDELHSGGLSREAFEADWWGAPLPINLERLDVEVVTFCQEIFPRFVEHIAPMAGVRDILAGMAEPLAVVTNTSRECAQAILEQVGLLNLVHELVTPEQVTDPGKPFPGLVEEACKRLGVEPARAVVVGDSLEDVDAAHRAGCLAIGLGVFGDHRIDALADLPALLQAWDASAERASPNGLHVS
jgi:HAD superfamily hydrolase (TIGR01509 family)